MYPNLNIWDVLDEVGTDWAECSRKVANGWKVAGAIRSLVKAKNLKIEYGRVLHETLLVPVLMYSNATMLWKDLGLELYR